MRARWVLALVSLAFVGTLAVVVGWRLTSEAMAVLVGVAAGVLASIPTSLIIVWVTTRQLRAEREAQDARLVARPAAASLAPPSAPPVIVVSPPAAQAPQWSNTFLPPAAVAPPRRFNVIGGDDGWGEGD